MRSEIYNQSVCIYSIFMTLYEFFITYPDGEEAEIQHSLQI